MPGRVVRLSHLGRDTRPYLTLLTRPARRGSARGVALVVLRPGSPPLGPTRGRHTRAAAAGRVAGGGRRGRLREMAGQPRVVRCRGVGWG